MYQKVARFRDLRQPRTDTNLFSYHLKVLLRDDLVIKLAEGYTLSTKGLAYVDRVSTEKFNIRSQPKIITMLLVQNSEGDVLLQKRSKQPYIDTWTFPYGKVHIDDESVIAGAVREAQDKLGTHASPRHVGDAYIRVRGGNTILSSTLVHICRFESDTLQTSDTVQWVRPLKIGRRTLAPAVEAIMARSFFDDAFFFLELSEDFSQ